MKLQIEKLQQGEHQLTTASKQKTANLPFDNSDLTDSKMNQLIETYRHLVSITINKKYNKKNFSEYHGIEYDELEQFGLIGLSEAIQSYDPTKTKSMSFQNYAITKISYSISNMTRRYSLESVSKYSYELQDKVSLDLPTDNSYGEEVRNQVDAKTSKAGYTYEDLEAKIAVERMLTHFPEHVQDIIKMRLGGMTLQEIGKLRGVSHQSIQQTLAYYEPRIKYYLGIAM